MENKEKEAKQGIIYSGGLYYDGKKVESLDSKLRKAMGLSEDDK